MITAHWTTWAVYTVSPHMHWDTPFPYTAKSKHLCFELKLDMYQPHNHHILTILLTLCRSYAPCLNHNTVYTLCCSYAPCLHHNTADTSCCSYAPNVCPIKQHTQTHKLYTTHFLQKLKYDEHMSPYQPNAWNTRYAICSRTLFTYKKLL